MTDNDDPEIHRAAVALLLAVLDGECDQRVHELLCRDDDPHFALKVAHDLAHGFVETEDEDLDELRAWVRNELAEMAAED